MRVRLRKFYKPLVIKKAGFLLFFYTQSGKSIIEKSNIKMLKKRGNLFSYGKI